MLMSWPPPELVDGTTRGATDVASGGIGVADALTCVSMIVFMVALVVLGLLVSLKVLFGSFAGKGN